MSKPSSLHTLWLRWKSLRLPWRRHILIGSDLTGNTFWEYLPRGVSRAARPRRILRPSSRKVHHGDVQVSPQWHQWLKQTRADAPSIQEQVQDLQRLEELRVNARLADARWEAKARYIEKPKVREEGVSVRKKRWGGDDDGGDETREVGSTAEVPNDTPDPWKKADETGGNPGEKWQPEAWSPGPKRA